MNNNELLQKVDVQKIAEEGDRIYQKIKINYEPKENGRFLAVDIESEKVYLGNTSAEALELARENHPNKVFYVVKIGFDATETLAKSFTSKH